MSHQHRAIQGEQETTTYRGPVAEIQDRAAHGGVRIVDRCACGATRETNRNQGHVERGLWRGPEAEPRAKGEE